MASGFTSEVDPGDFREQVCNFLRLLEHAGVEEIMLPGGGDALLAGALSLARGAEAGRSAEAPAGDGGAAMACAPAAAHRAEAAGPGVLGGLSREVGACRMCGLHSGRTNTVFGEGNAAARLMFIGEGPGADEDAQGRPFVGRAGVLLTKIIEAMGLKRTDVYIGNIVKCRPPGNRVPDPEEIASCLPYLEKQIEAIDPEIICTLGNVATRTLTGEHRPISEMRGKTYAYQASKVVPTYHPAACLRDPNYKKLVWEDIKIIMKYLDLPMRGVRTNGAGTNRN